MNKEDFMVEFTKLCEICNRPLTKMLTSIYYDTLSDISTVDFKYAIKMILRERVYTNLPMPAEFIAMLGDNINDKAILALNDVEKSLSRVGAYSSVCFKDKAIMSTISAMGGWGKLCNTTEYEWTFISKEFVTLYKVYAKKDNINSPQYFKGIADHSNIANGYGKQPSISYIGFNADDERPAISYDSGVKKLGNIGLLKILNEKIK
tara:strand:- start:54 stop:671 length:618 start_codon:yes stop_codon:yes gene_type:complete